MKVDINVKITEKDLNSFMLYHNYAGFQGKLSIVLGILAIIASVSTYGKVDTIYTIAYVAFGIILIVYTPVSIKMRSKKQFLLTPVFKEPIHYTIDEEGIQAQIGDHQTKAEWSNVLKVVINSNYIFIYTTRINATILPKSELGESCDKIIEIIKSNVDKSRTKIK